MPFWNFKKCLLSLKNDKSFRLKITLFRKEFTGVHKETVSKNKERAVGSTTGPRKNKRKHHHSLSAILGACIQTRAEVLYEILHFLHIRPLTNVCLFRILCLISKQVLHMPLSQLPLCHLSLFLANYFLFFYSSFLRLTKCCSRHSQMNVLSLLKVNTLKPTS